MIIWPVINIIDTKSSAEIAIWLYLIKDDDPHDLAFDDDDSTLVVDANSARVLKNVSAEFTDKLTVLVVDLNLK